MSLARKVAYNVSFQTIGKAVNVLIGLANVAIITRYLGVEGYGAYTTAFAYIAFFSVISDFGFFWIIVKRIAIGEDIDKVVKNTLSLRLLFASAVLISSLILVTLLPYEPSVKLSILIIALSIIWSSQTSVYTALFQSKLRMDLATISEVLGKLLGLGLLLVTVNLSLGLIYVVGASVLSTLFNYIFSFLFSLRYAKSGYSLDRQYSKIFIMEALPIGVVSILGLLYFKIDMVILSLFKGSFDVGIYGTPYKILEILTALPAMFVGSIFPALTAAFSGGDSDRLKRIFQISFDTLAIGAVGIAAIVLPLSKPLIVFTAGEEFVKASTISLFGVNMTSDVILQILIFAVGLSFINALFTNSIVVFGSQRKLIFPYAIATIFNLAFNFLLIPKYSYLAAAVTTVLTELIIIIATYTLVNSSVHVGLSLKNFGKTVFCGIATIIFLYLIPVFHVIIATALGASFFAILLYLIGVVNKNNLTSLFKK
jgi:O-antigen/teichoic acid export membrane protein